MGYETQETADFRIWMKMGAERQCFQEAGTEWTSAKSGYLPAREKR